MNLQPSQNSAYRELTITGIRPEADGVKTFILEGAAPIEYAPGQFLTFAFQTTTGEERRSYSFSSCPEMNEPTSITIKRVVNGKYSRPLIDHAQVGDKLVYTGVAGQFVLPKDIDTYKQLFFFAAGIGITPIYSLIKSLLHQHADIEVVLVYSSPSSSATVFYHELLALQLQFPGLLKLEFLFSSSRDLSKARLSKWLLPQLLNMYGTVAPEQRLFYTCGPFAYMRMVMISLEEEGYATSQERRENFDITRPAVKHQPPDTALHQVTLRLANETATIGVQYPKTILQAARERGLVLPYSCETGRCGSCMMHCESGRVWMSYNEVLTDNDIAEGKVLTCVGYPIDGDVALSL